MCLLLVSQGSASSCMGMHELSPVLQLIGSISLKQQHSTHYTPSTVKTTTNSSFFSFFFSTGGACTHIRSLAFLLSLETLRWCYRQNTTFLHLTTTGDIKDSLVTAVSVAVKFIEKWRVHHYPLPVHYSRNTDHRPWNNHIKICPSSTVDVNSVTAYIRPSKISITHHCDLWSVCPAKTRISSVLHIVLFLWGNCYCHTVLDPSTVLLYTTVLLISLHRRRIARIIIYQNGIPILFSLHDMLRGIRYWQTIPSSFALWTHLYLQWMCF
jgi:hypothetical protein